MWWISSGTCGYHAVPTSSPEVPRPKTGVTRWPGVMSLLISQVKYSAGAQSRGLAGGCCWEHGLLCGVNVSPQSSSMMRLFLKLGRWCNLDETRAISGSSNRNNLRTQPYGFSAKITRLCPAPC